MEMVKTEWEIAQDKLSELANELGLTNWRQWLDEFGLEAVTAALVEFDLETLPFTAGGI